ncbi:hypothetical protein BS78_09G022100 [Paspalum vaginatum]|nr:hypothetical protein BS78_09G022100 [Paspalum vaginatum]
MEQDCYYRTIFGVVRLQHHRAGRRTTEEGRQAGMQIASMEVNLRPRQAAAAGPSSLAALQLHIRLNPTIRLHATGRMTDSATPTQLREMIDRLGAHY